MKEPTVISENAVNILREEPRKPADPSAKKGGGKKGGGCKGCGG